MGKFDALAKALGLAVKKYGDDAAKILEKVDNPELAYTLKGKPRQQYFKALDEVRTVAKESIPKSERIPFKITNKDDELKLISPKAQVTGEIRDPETVEMLDPEMSPYLSGRVGYIPTLEAEKGYGSRALRAMEDKLKKEGAESIYLNASPLGGTRGLPLEDAAAKVRSFYEKEGYVPIEGIETSGPTNTMMYKKLMALSAMPQIDVSEQMNPLKVAQPYVEAYEEKKKQLTDALARQLNIAGAAPEIEKPVSETLSVVADPLNYVPAGEAIGLLQAGAGLSPKSAEMEALEQAKMKSRAGR